MPQTGWNAAEVDQIAFFPQALVWNAKSPYLRTSYHDVPSEELALTVATGLYQYSLLDVIDVADIVDRDPAEVADSAGLPIERVRRYEGPVLAEREHIAEQARGTRVGRETGAPGDGRALRDRPVTLNKRRRPTDGSTS